MAHMGRYSWQAHDILVFMWVVFEYYLRWNMWEKVKVEAKDQEANPVQRAIPQERIAITRLQKRANSIRKSFFVLSNQTFFSFSELLFLYRFWYWSSEPAWFYP